MVRVLVIDNLKIPTARSEHRKSALVVIIIVCPVWMPKETTKPG